MARSDERPDADRYLVDRIRKGDEDAWDQLIARYQGRLAAFARRKLGGGVEAEDMVQEAFVGFVQSLGGYDSSRSLETFLFTILRRCLLRAYRKTAAAEAMGFDPLDDSGSGPGLEDSGESPSQTLGNRELQEEQAAALADALYCLIREMRDRGRLEDLMVVELSFFVGMRNRGIAEVLGRPETHVAGIKHRAVQRVRELVGSIKELANDVSVSAVWRRYRLTCLKRSTLGAYQLGLLEEPWLSFCRFHLETVKCELCLANAEDLAAEAAETDRSGMRERIFASSVGFLSRSGQGP